MLFRSYRDNGQPGGGGLAFMPLVFTGDTEEEARKGAEQLTWYLKAKVEPQYRNPPGYVPLKEQPPKDIPGMFILDSHGDLLRNIAPLVPKDRLVIVDPEIDPRDSAEVARRKSAEGWFDVSTLKEPYRAEGKKTLGYELAEQLDWRLPDVILYPTGGGTGLIGMWKAFDEMEKLGWIGRERPRMYSVQAEGCQPIARAFQAGEKFAAEHLGAQTKASGLRVPKAIGDFIMLDALRSSHGGAIAVSEQPPRPRAPAR